MNDYPVRFTLKDEDRAPADLQALHADLSDVLQKAGETLVNLLHALDHASSTDEAIRLARIWGTEAHTAVVAALETREALSKGMRDQQWFSVLYATGAQELR